VGVKHDFTGLRSLVGFRFQRPVRLTDADVDSQQHLNNAAVARILNDLRVAYVLSGPGLPWRDHLLREGLVVVVRELHVRYDREAVLADVLAAGVRVSQRRGKAKIVEQRIVDVTRDTTVADAWAVQLLVHDGRAVEFPQFYWDALASLEGAPIPSLPPGSRPAWGPPPGSGVSA
jgi:acyl-CoA thioesterase FadM